MEFEAMELLESLFHVEELEKLLNAPSSKYVEDTKAVSSTAVDVKETPSSYIFVADMPGLAKSEIEVQLENDNVLSIKGKRKRDDSSEEGTKFLRMERKPTKFMRRFTLPGDAKLDDINASCQDGVLTVTVAKIPPEPQKPKTIQVPVT